MAEKFAKFIITHFFKGRLWVLIGGSIAIYFTAKYISELPDATPKDVIQAITGGTVVMALFYTVISYEYYQDRFKYDKQNSREVLSFNIATEWHKSTMVDYTRTMHLFLSKCKPLLEKNNAVEYHEMLESSEHAEEKKAILAIFNYFESISIGVKQGIMDEEFIKAFFLSIFESFYNEYAFYIDYRRRVKKSHRIWRNFTELSEKWINSK